MGKQFWKPGNMLYPLPAVMVSCQRENEKPNIITPVSYTHLTLPTKLEV